MNTTLMRIIAGDLEWQAMQQARKQAEIQAVGEFLVAIILIGLITLLILAAYLAVQKFLHK